MVEAVFEVRLNGASQLVISYQDSFCMTLDQERDYIDYHLLKSLTPYTRKILILDLPQFNMWKLVDSRF